MIHPTAIISPNASIGENTEIGPYCVIEDNVTLGDHCKLHSHVVIHGTTTIGSHNEFFPFASIGIKSQDLKYQAEPTYLQIGSHNVFRENTTIHRGTNAESPTTIGSHNLFLAYSHVAHDCTVGNHIILSNNGTLAGHVTVGDHAILSGLAGVHQFCRIGEHAMIGGMTKIVQDAPPFMIIDGNPGILRGVNQVGLQRRDFSPNDILAIRNTYKKLFLRKDTELTGAIQALDPTLAQNPLVSSLIGFIQSSQRGVTR